MLGVFVLHPATMVIYWLEFRPDSKNLITFVLERMAASVSPEMFPMNGLFVLLGAAIGGVFGGYHWILAEKNRALRFLTHELGASLVGIISGGEDEHTEFKSTARWDVRQDKINRALEGVLVKTVAGFLNHQGGSLVIGVSDAGEIVGLEADYQTLKHKNRDGFERFLMSLIKERLGGHVCSLIHPVFASIGGSDVCRLVVEPSDRPIYSSDGRGAHYFLRTGNATRELDVREAVEHIRGRGGKRRGRPFARWFRRAERQPEPIRSREASSSQNRGRKHQN